MNPNIELNATVVRRVELRNNLVLLRVKLDRPQNECRRGRVALVGIAREPPADVNRGATADSSETKQTLITRPYLVAAGADRKCLEFYVYYLPGGRVSPLLFANRPKIRLYVSEKLYKLPHLEHLATAPQVVVIAAGNSLLPFADKLARLVAADKSRNWLVVQSGKRSADLVYRDAVDAMAKQHKNLQSLVTLIKPPEQGEQSYAPGSLEDILDGERLQHSAFEKIAPQTTQILVCGNPQIQQKVADFSRALGFASAGNIAPGLGLFL